MAQSDLGTLTLTVLDQATDPTHLPEIAQLEAAYDTPMLDQPTLAGALTVLRESRRNMQLALIKASGRTVGLFGFAPMPEEGPTSVQTIIVIDPAHRRHGIARELVLLAAMSATNTGIPLFLEVRTADETADATFTRQLSPYVPTTRHTTAYAYETRRWMLTWGMFPKIDNPQLSAHITRMLVDAAP